MGKKINSRSIKASKYQNKKQIRNQLINQSSISVRRKGAFNFNNNSLNDLCNVEEIVLRNLIQTLDIFIFGKAQKKLNPLRHSFPKELNYEQFISLFLQGIEYAKCKFKFENLINLKQILKKLHDIDVKLGYNQNKVFPFLESKNKLEKLFKMDLLLSLVSDETITNIKVSQNKDSLNDIFTQTKEYLLYDQKDLFTEAKEYEDQNVNQNIYIAKFKELLFINTILNTFKEIINELYNVNLKVNEIKKKLIDFRKNHKIFFIEMPKELYGLTIFNGTILLNSLYLNDGGKFYKDSSTYFIIFFTLFHEYMLILSRLVRGDNNFFNNIGDFLKALNLKIKESGKFFEQHFLFKYLKFKSITKAEANYLLNKDNYVYDSSQEFGKNLQNFIKKNENYIKQLPRVSISKNENSRVELRIGCGFAGLRYNTFID